VIIIFKAGDDIRQDTVTLQLLRSMNAMWREEGVPVILTTYRCAPTWDMGGLVEVVTNAATVAMI